MVIQYISKPFTKIFGSRNDRLLKGYHRRVEAINTHEPQVRKLDDAQLRAKTSQFRHRCENGESIAPMLSEIMAVGREAMDRAVGIRNILNPEHAFDPEQLPKSLVPIYERVLAEADALDSISEPGCAKPAEGWMGQREFSLDQARQPVPGWMQVEIPLELYEAVRQLHPQSRPPFRARPFDVQLIGGIVLGEGAISEMKTGEGKTIVAPLACYVACVEGLQCHVVTTNSYLVQRDRDWVFPFYYWLGLTVGAIHPIHVQPPALKAEAYGCNVLYGTNSELGFDYLRDNMKLSVEEQMQKRRDFCIVDEIDSILIDEARTPLIISGPAHDDAPRYGVADKIARQLVQLQQKWDLINQKVEQVQLQIKGLEGDIRNARNKSKIPAFREQMKQLQEQAPSLENDRDQYTQYYEIEMEKKAAHLTHEGIAEAQKQAGVGSFYVGNNMDFPHLLENALRAHVVYKRDKDYVVREGEVVIVDEFTGRLMIGRQWSDGLHQAVESKEQVKIKQETQTLATVTIQNFFKLYRRLAGMTGTAITEGTEFHEIYKLDVICIPTNVSVIRNDRDDLIFLSSKDKWNSICDEIKRMHDMGRPVLVGTTSVEKSEALSQMLTKRHGIKHEVLNAKVDQAELEGNLVSQAGELGAVMIATNMAGRGTDIKLKPIDRDILVKHWQQRNMLPARARADETDEQLIARVYRHLAVMEAGIKKNDVASMSDSDCKLTVLRYWVEHDAWVPSEKAKQMLLAQCMDELDKLPEYQRHRLDIPHSTESLGGLHIVGTERHESRRIDNQLRGRSGRQGDRGSSRFFISLEDDLMKMFAGKTTMTALSKLGMKEGDAIEHRWVTRSVQRAQKKVEERNYEIRKNLLEYDEVMEHQRTHFYELRQEVLEGRNIAPMIFAYIADAVSDAVGIYLDAEYVQTQVAEWCRQTLDVSIEPSKLHLDDLEPLQGIVRNESQGEIRHIVDVTLGEYMSDDLNPDEWDLRGLSGWAMSRFGVDLKANRLRTMSSREVTDQLTTAAIEQAQRKDLSGLAKFLDSHYGQKELAAWARNKFGIELVPEQLEPLEPEQAIEQIVTQARGAYERREISYPVEFILDLVFQGAKQDRQWANDQLIGWVKQRYELNWTVDDVGTKSGDDLYRILADEAETWLQGGKLQQQVAEKVAQFSDDHEALRQWFEKRFEIMLTPEDLSSDEDLESLVLEQAREAMRSELTQLERFVLLQILDQAWKDHLYGMDQLKDAVGLRGYAERDPRIEYKREGASHFAEMQRSVRDRVTELIFRARLTPNVQLRSAYGDHQEAQHTASQSTGVGVAQAATTAASAGTSAQREDLAAAERAGDGQDGSAMTRKQRRAASARDRKTTESPAYKQRKRKKR